MSTRQYRLSLSLKMQYQRVAMVERAVIESSSGQDVVVEWSMGDRRVVMGRVASVTISSP